MTAVISRKHPPTPTLTCSIFASCLLFSAKMTFAEQLSAMK